MGGEDAEDEDDGQQAKGVQGGLRARPAVGHNRDSMRLE